MKASNDKGLRQRAYNDLTKRARGGIIVYIVAWLAIMMPNDFHISNPDFFYINTAILVILMIIRVAHFYYHCRRPQKSLDFANNWLVCTILVGALHWGLMSWWCLSHDAFNELESLIIATGATFAITGTNILGISKIIRLVFPAFMLLPGLVALATRASTVDLGFAMMGVLAYFYLAWSAKTASGDYWQSINNESLADQRARELEQLSITDQLTQLKNRLYFDQRFYEEWKRGARQNSPLSLLMVDLDHFKKLNDSYGHVFGDCCLQEVGRVLNSDLLRDTDIVARYGGEEFVVLMPETSAIEAAAVAEKLRLAIAAIDVKFEEKQVDLTCSIGGASTYPGDKKNQEQLLKNADNALYEAKRNGRNQYHACVEPSNLSTTGLDLQAYSISSIGHKR